MAGHSRPKGRRRFARLCPGRPRLGRDARRGCPAQGRHDGGG